MSKEINYADRTQCSSNSSICGHGKSISSAICFAGMSTKIIAWERENKGYMHYLLRYPIDKNGKKYTWFDHKKLFKNLNKIFGKTLTITPFLSGRRSVRIVEMKELKNFDKYLANHLYILLFVIYRAIDGENHSRWKKIYEEKAIDKPISNLNDLLYWYYLAYTSSYAHGINDNIMSLSPSMKSVTTYGKSATKSEFVYYKAAIDKYIKTLTQIFGKDTNLAKLDKFIDHSWLRQTPAYNSLENALTLYKKEKENE